MSLSRRSFLFLVGGVLAGCGLAGNEPDYTVVMEANAFTPASLVVPVGSLVAWHNRSDRVHTVTADPALAQLPERVLLPANAAIFNSGDLTQGQRWSYRFETVGTYVYFCRYYELDEMIGTVRVTA